MKHKLSRSEVRTGAATQLLDTLHRYVYARPLDVNEELLFEEIPLTEYALSAHVPLPRTALHNVLFDLACNGWYIMSYDDLDFSSDLLPEIREFLSFTFSEMRIALPQEFQTDDPDEFRVARDKYRHVFLNGLHFIVEDTFALAWRLRSLLADFNQALAARIRTMRLADDPRMEADGRLPRLRYLPSWLGTALHQRDGGICQKCGRPTIASFGSDETPHIDHVVALANGGGNDPTNLRILCAACNLEKGANNESVANQFAWPNARPI
jgi:5-methylcytosine-specific restriction endonuclease McrA